MLLVRHTMEPSLSSEGMETHQPKLLRLLLLSTVQKNLCIMSYIMIFVKVDLM